ncbi:cupin domain-containing protein [Streptomyces sp. NPDC046805]|uniref:cupin domain-containing protein n=1 Tax=Streptomyces sp. NPDC046805 TaxID=3155134 RepID=UPI0033C8EFD5
MIKTRRALRLLAVGVVATAAAFVPAAGGATAAEPSGAKAAVSGTEPPSPPTPTTSPTLPSETVKVLLEQELPNVPGKTFTSEVVDFPPSARAVPHRHGKAFVYAYVLEGTVRSQLDNEPVRTYRAGEHWVEPPNAYHALTENASSTEPAKLLAVIVSNTGDPTKVDEPTPTE